MTYQVDHYYDASDEFGVAWDDPQLAVPWPLDGAPLLSDRDQNNPTVATIAHELLVRF
jgi:dTDP-4-dehydrorhamnose 3,5-epimerase